MDGSTFSQSPVMQSVPVLAGWIGIESGQLMMLVLAVGALTLLMLSTRKRITRSRRATGPGVRDRYAESQRKDGMSREVDHAVVQLDTVARQVLGQLDTRFAKLEAVIRDADARIDELSRLVRENRGEATVDVTLSDEPPSISPPLAPDPDDERHGAIYRLSDEGVSAVEIARETGRTTGEIELVLALRESRPHARKSTPRQPESPTNTR